MKNSIGKKALVYGPPLAIVVALVVSGTLEWMDWPTVLVAGVILGGFAAMADSVLREWS